MGCNKSLTDDQLKAMFKATDEEMPQIEQPMTTGKWTILGHGIRQCSKKNSYITPFLPSFLIKNSSS